MEERQKISKGTNIHNYIFEELLGSGGFADVYKVKCMNYQQFFVAKVIYVKGSVEKAWDTFDNEISALMRLDHPHIIRLYNYFREKNIFFLILEYCPGGNLMDMIVKEGKLSESKLISISHQLIDAINFSHSMRISHRDIKPENILFDEFGRVKLADFGISMAGTSDQMIRDFKCSFMYAAPELLEKKNHSPYPADIWSIGVTIVIMATGQLPWSSNNPSGILRDCACGNMVSLVAVPIDIRNMIKACMVYDPRYRITASQLFEFIHGIFHPIQDPTNIKKCESLYIPTLRAQRKIVVSHSTHSINSVGISTCKSNLSNLMKVFCPIQPIQSLQTFADNSV